MLGSPGNMDDGNKLRAVISLAKSSVQSMEMVCPPNIFNKEESDENKNEVITQLLTTIPDSLINFNHKQEMPVSKEFLGVAMFADISGFTALTEKYSTMETSDSSGHGRGTDRLCATLNTYIGMIVDEIVMRKGDVLKFAGDAILALWKFSDIGHNAKKNLNKVIKCCFDIQSKCDNYMTEVGIVLRVKLAVAVGSMCLTIVGLPKAKQFDLSGSAIVDVGVTEKEAVPGSIILSQLAWANCEQSLFSVESIKKGQFFRVLGHSQSDTQSNKQGNEGKALSNLHGQSQKFITSDIDHLVDKILDYRQDMPKALQPDVDDEKVSAGFFLTQKLLHDKNKTKKKKKFDRKTMTCNLNDDEIKQLRAYVPGQVLYKLDHGQNLDWLSEMRQVSVLFINMQLPDFADEASLALQKSFEVIYEACVEFSGTLNKVFSFDKGCTFIVIFGLPGQKQEDDAIRALKCAHDIFESLHALPEITNESIGVTTGLAFCGVVGHKDRHEYTVIGSKVNMAARLMMFYPGTLTCDNDTYESARMRLREEDFIPMPFVELKGLKDPGTVRKYDPHSSKDEEEEEFDYPILGRKMENDFFKSLLKEYRCDKKKNVIVIAGDEGIGKTRLLEEFMDVAAKEHFKVIHLSLLSGDIECHVGSNMVKLLLGNSDEERQAAILPLMHEDQEIMDNVGLINDIVGDLQADTTQDIREVEQRRKNILIKIICMILDKHEGWYFFAIDNAINLDENSWKFLMRLLAKANIMISFAVRAWDSPEHCSYARCVLEDGSHKLLLEGLNKKEMVDFVCQLLHVNKIPKKICSIIETKCQGIPSWCEQLIENMLYSNMIKVIPQNEISIDKVSSENSDDDDDDDHHDYPDDDRLLNLTASQFIINVNQEAKMRNATKKHINLCNKYNEEEYVEATPGAIAGEINKICVISADANVNLMLVPDSVEDMVLARMDRMSLIEQTVIKCAAVLGLSFSRDLLKAIIPKNCANMLDTTLQNLSKLQFFECASLVNQSASVMDMQQSANTGGSGKTHNHIQAIHNAQILCGCYACDGYPAINLLQSNAFSDGRKRTCLFFHFCNAFVQKTAFALWLDDQKKALFEKAALYLEGNPEKCRSCGGNGFIPGSGVGKSMPSQFDKPIGKKYSINSKQRVTSISRADKNMRLQDLKKVLPHLAKDDRSISKSGDIVGMALFELATLYNLSKAEEKNTAGKSNFLRKKSHNSYASARMTLEVTLKNFCNSISSGNRARERTCKEIDLSRCQCLQLQALTTPRLVHYWKSAGNKLKTFQYTIDVASIALDINDNLKALDNLKAVDELIKKEEEEHFANFAITDEDKARIESLKGQAFCQMDCYDEGVRHYISALEYLKCPPPVNSFSFNLRYWKATLVQLLHQKMPGVFIDTKRVYDSNVIEQISILSNLARAFKARREYDKAYLVNLEQLNAAEEIAVDCWREVMIAYADMIGSLHLYGKERMGPVLEKAALQAAETSTANIDDMLAVANLHFSLLVFHSHTGNINKAFDSGSTAYNIGNSVKDVKFLLACIPHFVQVSMMKMRFHSCDSMLIELGNLSEKTDSRLESWTYLCCCIDMLLHADEYKDKVKKISGKLSKRNIGGHIGFAMNYVSNGIALWYARQNSWANAMTYYIDGKHQLLHHSVDPIFNWNAIAISTEFLLHQYRHNPTEQIKHKVQESLKLFQKETRGKGFLEGRRYHFEAYFAYLRKKYRRSRILLQDSIDESKDNELTFDYEWAKASKSTWFADHDDDVEMQSLASTIKYVLPVHV